MKIVALEEHMVTPGVMEAWASTQQRNHSAARPLCRGLASRRRGTAPRNRRRSLRHLPRACDLVGSTDHDLIYDP